MTDEQINIKIAGLCGWKDIRRPIDNNYHDYPSDTLGWLMGRVAGIAPGDIHWQNARPLPNYAADLNACHEFERLSFFTKGAPASRWEEYDNALFKICGGFAIAHADARQRCEAFLRVHNQWEETE